MLYCVCIFVFFFKQKMAYEMRISDWSSDVCSSDLLVDWSEHYYYKACMFSNVPNFAVVFGYLNASWTLRADIVAEYVCRVLNHMQDKGAEVATPILEDPARLTEATIFDFSSGYIQRALHIMPHNAVDLPWRLSPHYVQDRHAL